LEKISLGNNDISNDFKEHLREKFPGRISLY